VKDLKELTYADDVAVLVHDRKTHGKNPTTSWSIRMLPSHLILGKGKYFGSCLKVGLDVQ
jgi:hypothetical protein